MKRDVRDDPAYLRCLQAFVEGERIASLLGVEPWLGDAATRRPRSG